MIREIKIDVVQKTQNQNIKIIDHIKTTEILIYNSKTQKIKII